LLWTCDTKGDGGEKGGDELRMRKEGEIEGKKGGGLAESYGGTKVPPIYT